MHLQISGLVLQNEQVLAAYSTLLQLVAMCFHAWLFRQQAWTELLCTLVHAYLAAMDVQEESWDLSPLAAAWLLLKHISRTAGVGADHLAAGPGPSVIQPV